MAADSGTTFSTPDGKPGQIYEHAIKIVNLVKGLPIGAMTCGSEGDRQCIHCNVTQRFAATPYK
jgi:hypothetical protein